MHVHSQSGEKIFGAIFIGESYKCTPRQRKSPFLGNWGDLEGGSVSLVLLAGVLMVTTKKGSQLFQARKVHPRDCLLYTSPSPRDRQKSRMPSSA